MSNEYSDLPLDWIENDNEYIADTLYGRAIITEVKDATKKRFGFGIHNYRLRLEYVNGESENVHQIFNSLSNAQGWAYMALQDFDSRNREHSELNDLLTTLDLCRKSLSPKAQRDYATRLKRVENIIKKHFGQIP